MFTEAIQCKNVAQALLVVLLLPFITAGSCRQSDVQCLSGVPVWCGRSGFINEYCCAPDYHIDCCTYGTQYRSLSEIPPPDLTYTNLDGVVDFGTTTLRA